MLTKKLEKSESKLEDFQRDYISNKSFVNESIHNITEAWLQVSQILLNKTESLQSVLDAEKENIFLKQLLSQFNESLSSQNSRILALENALNITTTTVASNLTETSTTGPTETTNTSLLGTATPAVRMSTRDPSSLTKNKLNYHVNTDE